MKDFVLKLGFVGDVALTHDYDVLHVAKGPGYPFEFISPILKEHDAVVGNLEGPFCLGGETYPLKLSLRAHPGYIEGLKQAGFTAFTLGNNHILDYREQAFFETINILDTHGMKWCGAGKNVQEARKPAIIEKKGVKVAILSCCEVPIDSPFYAEKDARGIAPLDMKVLEHDIRSLRENVSVIIVSPHWGIEDWRYPHPQQVEKARRMIDMGADLVIGHHPHVIQGVERYKNGYIAYSLGNFLFSDVEWRWLTLQGELRNSQRKQSRARKQTTILSAEISRRGVRDVRMIPCRIGTDLRVMPLYDSGLHKLSVGMLSWPILLKRYDLFWKRYDELRNFQVAVIENGRRLKNIHKLRLSHFQELWGIVKTLKGTSAETVK